ncbi:hypothetical protein diail_3624 [Diaporthe ilicicola]|nr:hypothetical protein diail_3624 [Diaporthe ilicicola]
MAVNQDEDSVLILLSTNSPTSITHPERRIVLTQSQPTLKIGRSSNRSALALTPTLNNGYFDSPVMSREHAEIEADIPGQIIRIRDAGSMHGTYLNDHQLDTEHARPLVAGDQVTFGLPVYRNQRTFQPATVTVGLEFRNGGQADHSPSRVFTVPDDCSTDENEPLDDNMPMKIKIPSYTSQQEINPWQEEVEGHSHEIGQVDGVIEIESESESDAYLHDHISISSSDGDQDGMEVGELEGGVDLDDYDDESISLTDDEQTSSAPASPIESIDLDGPDLVDHDGTRSPSWNSVSTDPHSEHVEEQPPSGHNSEDEQGVFLYESESEEMDEEMDEIDPIDINFGSCSQSVDHQNQYPPPHPTHPVLPLPSISAVWSQPFAPVTFGYQLAPVKQPAPRLPSPSDAVLPVSRRHHGSEDDSGITVESLGQKSGKIDFFQAREQNKISLARSSGLLPTEASSVAASTSKTSIEERTFSPVTENPSKYPASSSAEVGKPSASAPSGETFATPSPHPTGQPAPASQALRSPTESQGNRALEHLSPYGNALLNSGEAFLNAPLEETFEMDLKAPEDVDIGWTAASADELYQMKHSAQTRTDQAPEYTLESLEVPVAAERPRELSRNTTKGKRKAIEISETTDEDVVWHEQSAADEQPVPSSRVFAQAEIETDLSKLSFHTTPEEEPTTARPAKIRKIAERVGYAALGGATVGVMVLTSLIYTAPNFA